MNYQVDEVKNGVPPYGCVECDGLTFETAELQNKHLEETGHHGWVRHSEPKKKLTIAEVEEKLNVSSVSMRNGVVTVRRGFFYRHGFTADGLVAKVKEAFPDAKILDSGEVWKPFRGGAPVAKQSHWFVKFSL